MSSQLLPEVQFAVDAQRQKQRAKKERKWREKAIERPREKL